MSFRRILSALALFTLCLPGLLPAAPPPWWSDPSTRILAPGLPAQNHAPANVGQLKNFATQAKKALDIQLAAVGGAGPDINQLIDGFEPRADQNYTAAELADWSVKNHAIVNLGQVKTVARVFYARLLAVGYNIPQNLITHGYPADWTQNYPWNPDDAWNQYGFPGDNPKGLSSFRGVLSGGF